MKVIITGANGQVGRALVRGAPLDIDLLPFSRSSLDITDEPAVSKCILVHLPDVIINAAAYTAADKAESEPDLVRAVNAAGPGHLAMAAQVVHARLVHISTDYVFDGLSSVPYRPDSKANPLSVYGVTKLEGELAVLNVNRAKSVVLRTAWVHAPQGRNFVNIMLRAMRENGRVRVVTDHIGTPTSAQFLAETIWRIVAKPEIKGIHHWTDAGVASWYDFAVAIAEEAATLGLLSSDVEVTPIATHEYPTPARRPQYSVLDKSSLISMGMIPMHWRKRLRSVLEEIGNA